MYIYMYMYVCTCICMSVCTCVHHSYIKLCLLAMYEILFVFQILGILSLSTGIYLYVNSKYATFTDGNSLFGASVLAAIGFGVLVIGFVGMVSAVWESRLLTIFVSDIKNIKYCLEVLITIPPNEYLANTIPRNEYLANTIPPNEYLANTIPRNEYLANTIPPNEYLW